MRRLIYLGCLVVGLLSLSFARAQEFRALVVEASGAGFLDAAQVTQLVSDCRTYNFNAIIVQVRRNGEAYYMPQAPNQDVRTTNIAAAFDALAEIIAQCHTGTPRIEVHAWVEANNVWNSVTPPADTNHVFNAHPEFLTKNLSGQTGRFLDAGNPAAMEWNYNMAKDIVSRYDIDGFVWENIGYSSQTAGFNDVAIQRYNAEMGTTGQPVYNSSPFNFWRRRQVTDFLTWTSAELLAIKPQLVISAVVGGDRLDVYSSTFENWTNWTGLGIVDLVMPRVYFSEAEGNLVRQEAQDAFKFQHQRRVYPWVNAWMNNEDTTGAALYYMGNKPFFGYGIDNYQNPDSGAPNPTVTFPYLRNNYQPTWQDTAELPWKDSPTNGIVRGTITRSDTGEPIYNATVSLVAANREQMTGAHGKFAFFETAPGTYTVEVTVPELGATNQTVTLVAGDNVAVNFVVEAHDIYPPELQDITATPVDESAGIAWKTNEEADSAIDYGTSPAYGQTITDIALSLNHQFILTGLDPGTVYHYRVRSRDIHGNEAVSDDLTFTTTAAGEVGEIIIDNPAARVVGSWLLGTSAAGKYGADYRYKTEKGNGSDYVEYRPTILKEGYYGVYVWYSQGSNRSEGVPYITTHDDGSTTVSVNQLANGGKWVEIGNFPFASGTNGAVRISDDFTQPGLVVIADAVKFVYLPSPAITDITLTNITHATATIRWNTKVAAYSSVEYGLNTGYGQTVTNSEPVKNHTFTLTGLDPEATYHFRVYSRDAFGYEEYSADQTFTTQPNPTSVGDIIIDNPEATMGGGLIRGEAAAGRYNEDYHYKVNNGTGTNYMEYRPHFPVTGAYEVFVWYPAAPNRSSAVPHIIAHRHGSTTVSVDQKINGAQWLSIGIFEFAQGDTGYVRITDGFPEPDRVMIADAVKFAYLPSLAVTNITHDSATIQYKAKAMSYLSVEYGSTTGYGYTMTNASLTQTHAFVLSGLLPDTTYHFRVHARDALGNEEYSEDHAFRTRPYFTTVDDIIIDNPEATMGGHLTRGIVAPGRYNEDYHYRVYFGNGSNYMEYRPNIPMAGAYEVFVWYPAGPNRSSAVPHIIAHQHGNTTVSVDQKINGAQWFSLGTFDFMPGDTGYVRITDAFPEPSLVMIADAVKFVYLPPQAAPEIVTGPASRSAYVGETVVFNLTLTGTEPFFYQWQKNGTNIVGETNLTLTLTNIAAADAGSYRMAVTNQAGGVVSTAAVLTVLVPAPVEVEQASILPDGRFYLKLNGETAGEYLIEVSSDLILWTELTTLNGGEDTEFYDTPPVGTQQRYYRVKWQP